MAAAAMKASESTRTPSMSKMIPESVPAGFTGPSVSELIGCCFALCPGHSIPLAPLGRSVAPSSAPMLFCPALTPSQRPWTPARAGCPRSAGLHHEEDHDAPATGALLPEVHSLLAAGARLHHRDHLPERSAESAAADSIPQRGQGLSPDRVPGAGRPPRARLARHRPHAASALGGPGGDLVWRRGRDVGRILPVVHPGPPVERLRPAGRRGRVGAGAIRLPQSVRG